MCVTQFITTCMSQLYNAQYFYILVTVQFKYMNLTCTFFPVKTQAENFTLTFITFSTWIQMEASLLKFLNILFFLGEIDVVLIVNIFL